MTIPAILKGYGFETLRGNSVWWGCGSLVWGHTAEIKPLGKDLYEVKYHHWYYDSWGDPVVEEEETLSLHGAKALEYLFERLPLWRYRR